VYNLFAAHQGTASVFHRKAERTEAMFLGHNILPSRNNDGASLHVLDDYMAGYQINKP
jgi:hypothetical protein